MLLSIILAEPTSLKLDRFYYYPENMKAINSGDAEPVSYDKIFKWTIVDFQDFMHVLNLQNITHCWAFAQC